MTPGTDCPDETSLSDLLVGALAEHRKAQVLAHVEGCAGAPRAALAHCQRALALDERAQGADAPDVAQDLACLAETHLALGTPEQAVPLLERARRLHARAPRDPLDEAWASFLLARALWEQRSAEAPTRATALAEQARVQLDGLGLRARVELRHVLAWQQRPGISLK